MSEWATHSAELARKSLDRLSSATDLLVDGEITEVEFFQVVDTLSEVTQGLIAEADWLVIDLVRRAIIKEKAKQS